MNNIISTVLTVAVLITSANSSARWHNQSQGGSSNHGHSKGMDHSKMSESEHSQVQKNQKSKVSDKDHHSEEPHGH
ncbi:hypothetical protein [uncultured Gammaproteobacteria bacterium]|nr:hypothetical protein [uncultured Gammaproteobacteria bacterium]